MARPKAFDPDAAVDQAMDLFWCRGYEATSVQDLVDRLGIGRASLYATFGSKDELWARALDRYRDLEGERAIAALQGTTALERIRALFEDIARRSLRDEDNRGCLMVNAAMERPGDESTSRRVKGAMERFESAFRELLEEARTAGDLRRDADPARLARFLVTALQGVRVMAKATRDERTVLDAVDVTLRALS